MLTLIKKQKIEELNNIELIYQEFEKLDEKRLSKQSNVNYLKEQLKKYNFVTKKFSKKYKEMNNQLQLITTELELIERKIDEKRQIICSFFETTNFSNNLVFYQHEFKKRREQIHCARTIQDFNMDFDGAKKYLQEHNLPVFLEEEDKVIHNNPISFNDINTFVLVHKTNYLPKNNRLSTSKEAGAKYTSLVLDRMGPVSFSSPRNTIHFTVNGEVQSHGLNSWDECKYAVVLPFRDLPISQLKSGAVMDTFIEGGLDLTSETFFLCPLEEVEFVSNANNNLRVLGYQGENVTKYADALVSMLGKKVEEVTMWGWSNRDDNAKYYQSFETIIKEWSPHAFTFENFYEKAFLKVNSLIAVIEKMIENNFVINPEEINSLCTEHLIFYYNHQISREQNEKIVADAMNAFVECIQKYGLTISLELLEEAYHNILDENNRNPSQTNDFILSEIFRIVNDYILSNQEILSDVSYRH